MDSYITPIVNNLPVNQNVIQLEFKQAMKDFKEMFPTLDLEVIEMVLRQNQGAVDSSINQLLEITNFEASKELNNSDEKNEIKNLNINSTPKEKIQKSSFNQLDLLSSSDQIDASFNKNSSLSFTSNLNNNLGRKSKWNPPLIGPLPDDFLRLECINSNNNINFQYQPQAYNQFQKHEINNLSQYQKSNLINLSNSAVIKNDLSSSDNINHYMLVQKLKENERQRLQLSSNLKDNETVKYLEDERIAIMLQDEEFVSDLRKNKEFITALNYDSLIASNNQAKVKEFNNLNYNSGNNNLYNFYNNQNFSDADFKEHLRNMGKISRKKFAQLAGLFSRKKSNLPLRDNLLSTDDQYTQLENDCSDNEGFDSRKIKNLHTKN